MLAASLVSTLAAISPLFAQAPVRSPFQVQPDARLTDIQISVFDSTGNKPLPQFRVIAGVRAGGAADDFEKRTGRTVVNWQPHTLKVGKDGDLLWPLAKAYDEMALRVEADGYQPQMWAWLRKKEGPQHLVFQLASDPGVAGRVLTPEGKPADGAIVALALAQRDALLDEGRLRHADEPPAEKPADQWRRPILTKTDAHGRFQLPTEIDPAAVLIIHDAGVFESAYDAWAKSPEIKLRLWGRIEGRVLWKNKPGAGEPVTMSIHRDDYGYPGMVAQYAFAKTDAEGKFTFTKVLPGRVQISRTMATADGGSTILPGMFIHLSVAAGTPTAAIVGGQGRRITGKLTGRDSWDGVTLHIHPTAPHIGFPGDDAQWKAFSELKSGPLGPIFFRDQIKPAADGAFVIDGVLPGSYQLFVSAPKAQGYAGSKQFNVAAEPADGRPQPQELGEIRVKSAMPPSP